ncbi:formyltetrahydrofolate deformylase [Aeromicrobium sp. 636]|uniref:Formyltetrahydrofolate deformylase n=2 Tax=Nocardioidaceae TaxID=85015 RepID=A0A8I0K091_9ACTN|nr:formyltetrahydrofolate deformylase [Aeromicrobium senzhongii]MCQ3998223.1 formyltetrahydrofolate deformylase [Aeromicrobium sp. 636]MTB88651.1 formyltetrahydrofolate deformylase [Aeromicrobium senzhongii]QNL94046.1 formyltetrahydrofolate deformylase [Aeromicrobium senzhongii]
MQSMDVPQPHSDFILTFACPDRVGIVATIASTLAQDGWTITESQQYADPDTRRFFMRVRFAADREVELEQMRAMLSPALEPFEMDWELHDATAPLRVVVMVSKQGHVLNNLLFHTRQGQLPIEIVAVVSNHPDWRDVVEWHGIEFHQIRVTPETKRETEQFVLDLMERTQAEALILARYMQILTDQMCRDVHGRAINIHHSLLPSFKGARPYEQAHRHGVKVIGATAHYVTADLDEGPIIEQDFRRVDHRSSAAELAAMGQDLEARALVHAVRAHAEHRVLLNGMKTVVFD